jgi:uncharacterized protein YndB with AHSA1/START domain
VSANSTRLTQYVNAPCEKVYLALLNADAVAKWMVPDGMTSHVHIFEPYEGGKFRISLTYDEPNGTGKTTAHTDTYHGYFLSLVSNQTVIEVIEFETDNPDMRGEMTITFSLSDMNGGTEVLGIHDHLPPGLSPVDNETGWRMSLEKLARLVESGQKL